MPGVLEKLATFLGRFLLGLLFLMSGVHKCFSFEGTTALMAAEGMIATTFFLSMAAMLEICGSLSVIVGYKARLGALARISHQAGGKTFFSSGRTGRPRGDGAGGHEPAAEAGWSVISRAFLQLGAGNLPATLTMSVAKPWRNVSSPFRREPTERAVPPDPTATANFEDWPAPGRRALDRDSFRPARTTLAAR